ncbi:hypothetical protein Tco_0827927 [Tanacetum coccineum]
MTLLSIRLGKELNDFVDTRRADVLCLRADELKWQPTALERRAVDLDRLADALDQRADALERRLDALGRRVDSNSLPFPNQIRETCSVLSLAKLGAVQGYAFGIAFRNAAEETCLQFMTKCKPGSKELSKSDAIQNMHGIVIGKHTLRISYGKIPTSTQIYVAKHSLLHSGLDGSESQLSSNVILRFCTSIFEGS